MHDPAVNRRVVTHWCVMCDFETTDEKAAYDHDCMKPGDGDE